MDSVAHTTATRGVVVHLIHIPIHALNAGFSLYHHTSFGRRKCMATDSVTQKRKPTLPFITPESCVTNYGLYPSPIAHATKSAFVHQRARGSQDRSDLTLADSCDARLALSYDHCPSELLPKDAARIVRPLPATLRVCQNRTSA